MQVKTGKIQARIALAIGYISWLVLFSVGAYYNWYFPEFLISALVFYGLGILYGHWELIRNAKNEKLRVKVTADGKYFEADL